MEQVGCRGSIGRFLERFDRLDRFLKRFRVYFWAFGKLIVNRGSKLVNAEVRKQATSFFW